MRRRRAAGSSSLGTLRATSRDITSKSKVSRWVPPSEARRASGRCPACEWMNAARRMSESLIISRSTVVLNALALRACAPFHTWSSTRAGMARSQSRTSPSSCSFSAMCVSTPSADGSPGVARRGAASAQSSVSLPLAPAASSTRISRSSRSTCLRSRSPSSPRGAISCSTSSTTDESERSVPAPEPRSTSTSGKS